MIYLLAVVTTPKIVIVVPLLLLAWSSSAGAQPAVRPWELGVIVPIVRFVEFDSVIEQERQLFPNERQYPLGTWWELGPGVRVGRRVTRHVAVEVDASLLPRNRTRAYAPNTVRGNIVTGGQKGMLVAGAVVRKQLGRASLLASAKAGAAEYAWFPDIVTVDRFPDGRPMGVHAEYRSEKFFALQAGGGVEASLGARMLLRADVGDLFVAYRPSPRDLNPAFSRHNLQITAAASWRF